MTLKESHEHIQQDPKCENCTYTPKALAWARPSLTFGFWLLTRLMISSRTSGIWEFRESGGVADSGSFRNKLLVNNLGRGAKHVSHVGTC